MKTLKIVSRKSPLARIQALLVAEKIAQSSPDIQIQHTFKSTLGDADLTTPLNKMPDIGVFTNDIRDDLLSGEADIAVHSWKDLPVELEEGTEIVGTTERADMRDMLFLKKGSTQKKDLIVLSSSPRREKNLSNFLPIALPFQAEISFKDVRGNIHTRLKKLIEGEEDALVVAKAAIDRFIRSKSDEFKNEKEELLEIVESLNWMVLPLSQNPCAAAQGALAIEARQNDGAVKEVIAKFSNQSDFNAVEIERSILKSYGGGCHQKIGVSNESLKSGNVLTVKGETEDGKEISERSFNADATDGYFDSVNAENFFPKDKTEQQFFKREPLSEANERIKALKNYGIYVSRSNTLETPNLIDKSNIIWTSGIDTWKSLAKKGYWVNGSSDSLGEDNSKEESPFKKVNWLKISHKDNLDDSKELLATYKLTPLDISNRLEECEYFYWMSASSFKLATKQYPEIINRNHACGLGKTFDLIQAVAPNTSAFLSYENWKEEISKKIK